MNAQYDALAEYRLFPAASGEYTAEHTPSAILLHSKVDPVREAEDIAGDMHHRFEDSPVLIGGGLGYLAEALLTLDGCKSGVTVIEPDPVLYQMAKRCRAGSTYLSSERIKVITAATIGMLASRIDKSDGSIIVSPYLERITAVASSPLAGFIQRLRSERVSWPVYKALLAEHKNENREILENAPSALSIRLDPRKHIVVAGAGPSLDECLQAMNRNRSRIIIVAASGAVPALLKARILPDWVIALEARSAILEDLKSLPLAIPIIAFPSVNPGVMRETGRTHFNGTELEARGGTTVIPAIDFSLRCSKTDLYLVGVDLGAGKRTYASGTNRDHHAENRPATVAPKYIAMRNAIESLLRNRLDGRRMIYHVLRDGDVLQGTQRLLPEAWFSLLTTPASALEMV